MHTPVISQLGEGQAAAQTPQTAGWCLLFSLFPSPLGGREKKIEKEEETYLPACSRSDSNSQRLSPSFPPTVPFLQKLPGSSRRDPQKMRGTYHPVLGPFRHCWSDGFTCLHPSLDCEFPDHRVMPVSHRHPQHLVNSRYSVNALWILGEQH